MNIFIVILEHEHGTEAVSRRKENDADLAAVGLMRSTMDELEELIDGDADGVKQFDELHQHLVEMKIDKAMDVYNDLYADFAPASEIHRIIIKQAELK